MNLTANEREAIRRYTEPSFRVVLKPYRTVQHPVTCLTFVICNYCNAHQVAGTGFTHELNCPEHLTKQPRRKVKAFTRIFHMTAYAEIDENGTLIIP